jgi:dTDP-4-amino-4,6-dideoxygalactose transaminase
MLNGRVAGTHSFVVEAFGLLRFPILVGSVEARTRILEQGNRLGLGIGTAYPLDIGSIPDVDLRISNDSSPEAARFARELVTLPTHSYVSHNDVMRIARLLSNDGPNAGHAAA